MNEIWEDAFFVAAKVIMSIILLAAGIVLFAGMPIMVYFFVLVVIPSALIASIKTLWELWRGSRRPTPKDTQR